MSVALVAQEAREAEERHEELLVAVAAAHPWTFPRTFLRQAAYQPAPQTPSAAIRASAVRQRPFVRKAVERTAVMSKQRMAQLVLRECR